MERRESSHWYHLHYLHAYLMNAAIITNAHRWCNCIQQLAPVCSPTFLGRIRVHNPNDIDRFTADGSVSLGMYFPQNCHFTLGDLDLIYIVPWAHPTHNQNNVSIGSAVFAQLTAYCPYTLQWTAPRPQNCPFPWGCGPPSNTWYLEPTRVLNPNSISISSAVFAGLTGMTDRPNERPHYSVYNNRPHLCTM